MVLRVYLVVVEVQKNQISQRFQVVDIANGVALVIHQTDVYILAFYDGASLEISIFEHNSLRIL